MLPPTQALPFTVRSGVPTTATPSVLSKRTYLPNSRSNSTKKDSRLWSIPGNSSEPVSPFEALQLAAAEQGVSVVTSQPEDAVEVETWEDVLEDFDDPWMRDPGVSELVELLPALETPSSSAQQAVQEITRTELDELLLLPTTRVKVLDVRSSIEHSFRSYPGSRNIPLKELTLAAVEDYRSASVVVMDSGDTRARQACLRLQRVYGITDVRLLVN